MLRELEIELGENYISSDSIALENILENVTTNALFISNRSNNEQNIALLKEEIKKCAKTIYLQRGSEDVTSLSQNGISSSYTDAMAELRKNIINNGKRLIK